MIIQSLNPLQFGARDQDCVLAKRTGIWSKQKKTSLVDMEQQVNDGRMEADHSRLDYRIFTDDEEVTLLPHKRDTEVPNNPGSDIHDGPDTSDTQREDWLLQTEPLHGVRPRQTDRERPAVINDRSGVLDLEAAGGVGAGRWIKMESRLLCCHSSDRSYWRRK